MRRSTPIALALFLVLAMLAPAAATAKKNDPNVRLTWAPTSAVAEASAAPTSEMRAVTAALVVTDDRAVADKAIVGIRTDDEDRHVELRATTGVADFVETSLASQARRWGFAMADEQGEAGVLLVAKLTQLAVEETNQAVGATYSAEATLEIELRDSAGKTRAKGSYFGDASRYGKKFSNENTNEVLSDALAEAFANALGDPSIRNPWGGTTATGGAAGTAAAAGPITPENALREVRDLMADGTGEAAVESWLRGQTLTRALGAEDLARWREAGVPEPAIRVAMTLPVG
jgi:uncharacterized lipoprotein YajG